MVKIRFLMGIVAVFSFVISQPLKPPDEGVVSGRVNRSPNADDVTRSVKPDQHLQETLVDQNLLFRVEGELDALAQRLTYSPHPFVRRSSQEEHEDLFESPPLHRADHRRDYADWLGQDRLNDAVSRRVQSALQKRGAGLSTFWNGEQFEPTTTEPTPPFDPPLDPQVTRRFLQMDVSDTGHDALVEFHRRYNKVLDPATVPPGFADMFARRYQGYQRMFPRRNEDPRLLNIDQAMNYYRSDVFRNRMASMNDLVNRIARHADALRLDAIRRSYVEALQHRFDTALEVLSGSEDLINLSGRFVGESSRPLRTSRQLSSILMARIMRIQQHFSELRLDHDLLVKLETEFDDLVQRTLEPGPHILRRSIDTADGEGEHVEHALLHPSSLRRRDEDRSDTLRWRLQQRQRWRSMDEMLQFMALTRDDPGALAIADFLRRPEQLLPSRGVRSHDRRELANLFRPYKQRNPISGLTVDYDDDLSRLLHDMAYSSGRDRFRDIRPIIDHMLTSQEALKLNGPRVAFLEAVRGRFVHTEAAMTPTVDEIHETRGARELRAARMLAWTMHDFSHEPVAVRERLRARLEPVLDASPRFLQDLHLLQRVEIGLEQHVRRFDAEVGLQTQRSVVTHLKKRSLLSSTAVKSTAEGRNPENAKLGASHPVDLHPRSGESPSRPESIWREPSAWQETLEMMGLDRNELGAEAIGRFHALGQPLFQAVPRSGEAMQELRSVYRTYQLAHPVRGQAVDVVYDHIFHAVTMEAGGRNRFRDAKAVLTHLIDNAVPLRLDSTRVRFLQALRQRFDLSARLLSPTPDEILRRGAQRLIASIRDRSPAEEMVAENNKILEFLRVRTQLAKKNEYRFDVDSSILSYVEESLDHFLQGGTRMVTGRPIIRRDNSAKEPAAITPEQTAFANVLYSKQEPEQGGVPHSLQRRRNPSTSDKAVPGTPSQPAPAAATAGQQEIHQAYLGRIAMVRLRRGEQALLPRIEEAPEQREWLSRLFQDYRNAVPAPSQVSVVRMMMEDVGRNRFTQMEPILSYLVANQEALHLDRGRVALLQTLMVRFRETRQMMSPTLDDVKKEVEKALKQKMSGALSQEGYQQVLRKASRLRAYRSMLAWTQGSRMKEDLDMITRIEEELSGISGHIEQTADTAVHLVRRDATVQADEDQRHHSLEKRMPTFLRRTGERAPTDAEMQAVIAPLGMHRGDPYWQPIAVYRLSEGSLLEGCPIPSLLQVDLAERWRQYRLKFWQRMPFNVGALSVQAGMYPLIDTDEGGRFRHANEVIKFLLDNGNRLRLTVKEYNYLEALQHRFEMTNQLMQPLPSTLSLLIRAHHPQASPVFQQHVLRSWLITRRARIQARPHSIDIDMKLLHTFESELDYLHNYLPRTP